MGCKDSDMTEQLSRHTWRFPERPTPALPSVLRGYLILNSMPPCGGPHFSLGISHTYMRCTSVFLFLICLSLQESRLRIQKIKRKWFFLPYNMVILVNTRQSQRVRRRFRSNVESLWGGVKSKVSNMYTECYYLIKKELEDAYKYLLINA